MKKIILLAFTAIVFRAGATDLIVQESGPVGTYSSISAAVAAAVAGDRVIVNNRIGNVPWNENVTITKPLEILSAAADTFFIVQGNYTITLASQGTVTIIGMKNISGSISSGANGPGGTRSIINIMGCWLQAGSVNMNADNFDCRIAGNYISGSVTIRFGKVIGNEITSILTINTDAVATNDTIFVIANKDLYQLVFNSTNQFYYIANNAIIYTYSSGCCTYAMDLTTAKNSGTSNNMVLNNSVNLTGTNNSGIKLGTQTLTKIDALNNCVRLQSATYSCFQFTGSGSSANVNVSYNSYATGILGVTNNGTNVAGGATFLCGNILQCVGLNNGHPDPIYSDLDLTPNDMGPFGGSFSLDNFFSTQCSTFGGGKGRVYYVNIPRKVVQGNTINIKGEAYDR